jgi:hypothetical protein
MVTMPNEGDHSQAYHGPALIIANGICPNMPTPCTACVEQAIAYIARAQSETLAAELTWPAARP